MVNRTNNSRRKEKADFEGTVRALLLKMHQCTSEMLSIQYEHLSMTGCIRAVSTYSKLSKDICRAPAGALQISLVKKLSPTKAENVMPFFEAYNKLREGGLGGAGGP